MLTRTLYLSLDPYMRGRDAKSYSAPVPIGGIMVGRTIGEVVASRDLGFAAGDVVLGFGTGRTTRLFEVRRCEADPASVPVATALGVLGMPAHTAYVGVLDIGQPQSGETVVVSAASGAVGSLVEQEAGKDRLAAAVEACRLRLRPILMTSFAFILGVLPLVIAKGAGAEMRQSLGTAVSSGMLGVTFFGLF